eukprot:2753285-Rhodomonas_salina.1
MAKQATAETKMKVSVKKVSLPRKHAQQDKYVVMHGRVKEELEWECNDLWSAMAGADGADAARRSDCKSHKSVVEAAAGVEEEARSLAARRCAHAVNSDRHVEVERGSD